MTRDMKIAGLLITGAAMFWAMAYFMPAILSIFGLDWSERVMRTLSATIGLIHLALFYRHTLFAAPDSED